MPTPTNSPTPNQTATAGTPHGPGFFGEGAAQPVGAPETALSAENLHRVRRNLMSEFNAADAQLAPMTQL